MKVDEDLRKRQFAPKSRTGCTRCKEARKKCGEELPICSRCAPRGFQCIYPHRKIKTRPVMTALQPRPATPAAAHFSMVMTPSPFFVAPLSTSEANYFDYFRSRAVYQLDSHLQNMSSFWLRTVLREGNVDDCVRDAVLCVGAMTRARNSHHINKALFKLRSTGPPVNDHDGTAIKFYARALSKLRARIHSEDVQPRTILVITTLLAAFEMMQGNVAGVDKHLGSCGLLLQRRSGMCMDPSKSSFGSSLDDEGITEVEFFTARTATIATLMTPMQPVSRNAILSIPLSFTDLDIPGREASLTIFWQVWLRYQTVFLMWYVRVSEMLVSGDRVGHARAPLQEQRAAVIYQTAIWQRTLKERFDQEDKPHYRRLLKVALMIAMLVKAFAHGVFQAGEEALVAAELTYREAIRYYQEIFEETPPGEVLGGIGWGSFLSGAVLIIRESRSYELRQEALRICKELLSVDFSWHLRTMLLAYSALIELEECGRDERGALPTSARWTWTDGTSWNDDTELGVTFTSKRAGVGGVREEKHMTLHIDLLKSD